MREPPWTADSCKGSGVTTGLTDPERDENEFCSKLVLNSHFQSINQCQLSAELKNQTSNNGLSSHSPLPLPPPKLPKFTLLRMNGAQPKP